MLAEMDLEEWEDQAAFLAALAKSADWVTRECAASGLDQLNRLAAVGLVKVGPKGYEHGWIFVGAPGVGAVVHHSTHGRGIVTRSGKKTSGVQFDSGHHAAFEHGGKPGKDGSHFVERATRGKPKAPKPTVAAKPTAAEPKSDLRDTARAHGISGGHYDRNFHSTLDNIQRQHGGKKRETAAALRQAARRERAHRRSLPAEGYELNHSNSKTSERGYRQLADVVEGKANKSIDIDKHTVKRMHDATERAEEIAFLRKFVDHSNLGIREAAEARLGLLAAGQLPKQLAALT